MRAKGRYDSAAFRLPKETYMETIWYIRGYPTALAEYEDIPTATPLHDGQPRSGEPSDPTFRAADKRIKLREKIDAVQKAQKMVPPKFVRPILENIIERKDWDGIAAKDIKTYKKYKQQYVWWVAYFRNAI